MLVGCCTEKSYARAINASWFVPTCGTVAKEIVRKHFEIPGCKACLITEKSAALESAGFVDMQNCVFADEATVLDKLAHLFAHPDELTRIIQDGYEFVHSHHTLRQRDQILQWFYLHKVLQPGQKIIQKDPFLPLAAADGSQRGYHLACNGVHLTLLKQGDAALWGGDYATADALYQRSAKYLPWMPEPKFRLALSSLYQGDANAAYTRIAELIQYIIGEYKAADPDPVEWAYLIVSLLCLGKLNAASRRASQFPALHHSELDCARWAVEALKPDGKKAVFAYDENRVCRCSIHQMPHRGFKDWVEQICIILRACQQSEFSAVLMQSRSLPQGSRANSDHRRDVAARQEGYIRRHLPTKGNPAPRNITMLAQPATKTVRMGQARRRSSPALSRKKVRVLFAVPPLRNEER